MERKEELDALSDSRGWLRTAISSAEKGDYNIGIYSLEMAVEIALKAVLISLNVAYPKTHDIMAIFVSAIDKGRSSLPNEFVENETFIVDTFRELLKMRGPAGYTFSSNFNIKDLKGDFKKYLVSAEKIIKLCEESVLR